MPGDSDYFARKILDHKVGKTAMGALPTAYLALFTSMPSDAGAGAVETDYGSYARKQTAGADWNAASGSAPSSTSNANPLTFATPTSDPTVNPAIGFGIYDAASAGNLLHSDYLGGYDWLPFTADTADLITCKAHGYAAGDRVVVGGELGGGTLPAGLGAGTLYYVLASGLATDAFKVSLTAGGAAVDITATGNGMVRKVTPMTINNGIAPSFAAGQITLKQA